MSHVGLARGGGGCCCSRADALAAYSAGVGRPLERAAVAATAETVVDEGRDGRLFLPIRDAVLAMGVGVGLLAWLRSRGFVRVREAVGTCIDGGEGQALGVVWVSVSISDSESPSSPQDACGTFESAAYSPGGAGRIGVGDYVKGFELSGSEGPPEVGVWPDIFWRDVGTQVSSSSVSGTGPQISRRRSQIKSRGEWEEVCNSPEDTVDYWGELIWVLCAILGAGVSLSAERGYKVFFLFFF